MSNFEKILKAAFEDCDNCIWQSTDDQICIFDSENGKCIEVQCDELHNFSIENPNNRRITLVSVDKCLYDDQSDHEKCDLIFFTETELYFLEIKDSINRSSSRKNKAKSQLKTSIRLFENLGIKLDSGHNYAIISWKYKPSRPAVSTAMQNARIEFYEDFQTILVEGNMIKIL